MDESRELRLRNRRSLSPSPENVATHGWGVFPGPEDFGDLDEEQSILSTKGKSKAVELRYACPYYKRYPVKYITETKCHGSGWPNVTRVKEHLYRNHRQAPHCPRCGTTFSGDNDLQAHLQDAAQCDPREHFSLDGFDAGQEEELRNRKGLAKMTEEGKWERVYRILFPAEIYIPTPYNDTASYISEDISKHSDQQFPEYDMILQHMGSHWEDWDKMFSYDDYYQGLPDGSPFPTFDYPSTTGINSTFGDDLPLPDAFQSLLLDDHLKAFPFLTSDTEANTTVDPGSSECVSIQDSRARPIALGLHSSEEVGEKGIIDSYSEGDLETYTPMEHELPGLKETREDDIPYTDSGYESVRGLIHTSMHEKDEEETGRVRGGDLDSRSDMEVNDANTSYSDFSMTLPQAAADKSIIDICNDIHQRLEGLFNAQTLKVSSQRLPTLIKAFAVKLGSDMPDQLSLRVMHFVHTHHQYIVAQLENRFHYDEVDAMSSRNSMDTMPLDEIMSRWGEAHSVDSPTVDASEYFEGVEDDTDVADEEEFVNEKTVADEKDGVDKEDFTDEEDMENEDGDISAFSGYEKTIMESVAYEWLISSLAKEASLNWDESQPRTMVDQIRQEILSQLPTGRISSKRPPNRHTVSFKILKSSLPFLLEDWRAQSTVNSPNIIADRTVVTSASAYSVQVSKVSHYMDQIWPLGGETLLSVLQNFIDGIGHTRVSRGDSDIEIMLKGFYLEAIITGTPYSIAEYGEQLAWLTAALQPAVYDTVTYVTPSIQHIEDCLATEGITHSWVIGLWQEGIDEANPIAHSMQDWLGELKKAVIVRGFPTMSRPENCPGIEVARQLLVSLSPTPLPVWKGTRYLLFATGKVLQLFRQTKSVNIWHILGSPGEVCTCRQRFLENNNKHSRPCLGSVDLWQKRHIITECCVAESCYRDTIIQTEPGVGSMEIPQRECSLSEAPRLTPYSENAIDSLDSLDVDMLSISDSSEYEAGGPPDTDDAALGMIEAIASCLVSEYRQYTDQHNSAKERPTHTKQCSPGRQQSSTPHGSSQSTLGLAAAQPVSSQLVRKRPVQQDDSDGDEESQRRPVQKKQKKSHSSKGLRLLACPFWKQNPGKHSNCFGKKLNMISRVKQHLTRSHYPEFYCEKCLAVFPDEESKHMHLRATPSLCEWNSGPLEGITHLQHRSLSRKPVKGSTEPQQWFAVWDIVFPNIDRPLSPYIDPELSQDLYQYHEFCERQGPAVFLEAFQEEGLGVLGDSEREALFRRGVIRGMRMLPDQWLSYRAATSQTSASDVSSTAASNEQQCNERRRAQVPAFGDRSSNADSGIDLRSQPSSGLARESANPSPYPLIRPRPPSDVNVDSGLPATTDLSTHAASFSSNGANISLVSVDLPPTDVGSLDVPTQDEANHLTSVLTNSDSGAECPDNLGSDLTWNHFPEDFDFSSFQSS